jgi:hypothetical protein
MYEYIDLGYRTRFETYTIQHTAIDTKSLDENSALQVECDTLDSILANNKVDVMKIDIEGAEVLALKGATNTLKKLRKIIVEIHEYNFEKAKDILETHNFKLETMGKWIDWKGKQAFHGHIIGSNS